MYYGIQRLSGITVRTTSNRALPGCGFAVTQPPPANGLNWLPCAQQARDGSFDIRRQDEFSVMPVCSITLTQNRLIQLTADPV
jgi:hypothetical protein